MMWIEAQQVFHADSFFLGQAFHQNQTAPVRHENWRDRRTKKRLPDPRLLPVRDFFGGKEP
jgi:hypothetical protein